MSQSRILFDPYTHEAVVLSPRRIMPPPAFGPGRLPVVARCPFCPGHEALCEAEVDRIERDGEWVARAFPNRRPAVSLEDAASRSDDEVGGRGIHEVIVMGREHDAPSIEDRSAAWRLAARRMADLRQDPELLAFGWFENRGVEAGSTQPHAHGQLVGTPVVPERLRRFAHSQEDESLAPLWFERARLEERVIVESDAFIVMAPWAPSVPFEVHIMPRQPASDWGVETEPVTELAALLDRLVRRLDGMSGFTSHHWVAETAPRDAPDSFRWRIRLIPRVVVPGGFEVWSGSGLHPTEPRECAAMFREPVA